MPDDPYADPITGILRNKLGLDTAEDLATAEREITQAALMLVSDSPIRPTYDLSHLCAIHRTIFGDIYEWAGRIRTVAIAKGSPFCLPQYIESASADIFRALHGENLLRGLERRWQHLDADRNIEASAAIMRGDAGPMRKMLDTLVTDET